MIDREISVVFASHTAPTGVFRVGSHHLSREIAKMGFDVAHVSTPVSLAHALRPRSDNDKTRVRWARSSPARDVDNVLQVIPMIPVPLGSVPSALRPIDIRLPTRRWSSMLPGGLSSPDLLIIDQPYLVDLVRVLKPRRLVYRPTDAHYAKRSRHAELKILESADAIVATSQRVLDEVRSGSPFTGPTLVLENGVEYDRFAVDASTGKVRYPGIVYLGAIDRRFDWEQVAAIAQSVPDIPVTIAGPYDQAPRDLPANVVMVGPIDYADAPGLLASATIGILPFSDDPGNEGRSPMKYYEYLAAGLSVVARSSASLRERCAPGVWLYDDPKAAGRAVRAAVSAPAINSAGIEFARDYSWSARAEELMQFLEGAR